MFTVSKWRSIDPYKSGNRPGYCVSFTHPQTHNRVNRGLETADIDAAKKICVDLERLVNNPAWWNHLPIPFVP